jgi:5-methylcytosine-specific restriction protein B
MNLHFNREDLIRAIQEIDKNPSLISGRHSSTYDLVFEGKKYPPILVLSIANTLKGNEELTLSSFGNNVEIPFKHLRDNGFEIKEKKNNDSQFDNFTIQLKNFLEQAKTTNLKTKNYTPKYLETKVKVSFGQGGVAHIPWISFLIEPNKTSEGIYPVYLYYKEFQLLILAYGVSETIIPLVQWKLPENTKTIREYFKENFSKKPERYGSSFIHRVYDVNNLPDEKTLEADLIKIIEEYKLQFTESKIEKVTMEKNKFSINDYHNDVLKSGLIFSEVLINRFVSSLLTKPFVLLTGLSGSGKTKIAQSFVQWICQDKSQYKIIPVGADWTNREPLLGYPNGLNQEEYITPDSGALNLIITAAKLENASKPYFLILDEMNLSHVERYFADFLSIMESDDRINLYTGNERIDLEGNPVPNEIFWPKNLFIIGTVNIDETTYMFSPKVLDRANTIEFRVDSSNLKTFFEKPMKIDLFLIESKGAEMAENFLEIAQDKEIQNEEIYKEAFLKFFEELKKVGAEFGYRTATEMLLLIKKLKTFSNLSDEKCLDIAIMQKLLPKLHGSRSKIVKVLDALILLCLKEGQEFSIAKCDEVLETNIIYPISYEKLIRMYKNVLDNGFTSYAEA